MGRRKFVKTSVIGGAYTIVRPSILANAHILTSPAEETVFNRSIRGAQN